MPEEITLVTCPYCGRENAQSNAVYCSYCGSSLQQSGNSPPASPSSGSSPYGTPPPSYPGGGVPSYSLSNRFESALHRVEVLSYVAIGLTVIILIAILA